MEKMDLTPEWKRAFAEYENISGFEPQGLEDITTGKRSAVDVWTQNIRWLERMVGDVTLIPTPID